jgi:hypothetical protein
MHHFSSYQLIFLPFQWFLSLYFTFQVLRHFVTGQLLNSWLL